MMWKVSCDHTLPSPVPFHSLQVLLLATQWPVRAPLSSCFCWGGGEPWGGPAISLQYHVSLIQWTNRLFLTTRGSSSRPRGATHTLELELLDSTVSLQYMSKNWIIILSVCPFKCHFFAVIQKQVRLLARVIFLASDEHIKLKLAHVWKQSLKKSSP